MQNGTDAIDFGAYDGFTVADLTNLPLDQENTLSMVVNSGNYDEGECELILILTKD